jgi:hypothetical protein
MLPLNVKVSEAFAVPEAGLYVTELTGDESEVEVKLSGVTVPLEVI